LKCFTALVTKVVELPSVLQSPIQQSAGRSDERLAGEILLVAGLFAHQHQGGAARARARHRLGSILEEGAAPAGVSAARSAVSEVSAGPGSLSVVRRCAIAALSCENARQQAKFRPLPRHKDFFISSLRRRIGPAIASRERAGLSGAPSFST
jgi:hypothetical protein